MVMMLGVSLLNPSDSFIEYAQTISNRPAKIRKNPSHATDSSSLESGRPDEFSQYEGGRSS